MVPAYFVHLDRLPLTANGKLDRTALPDHTLSAGEDLEAPSGEIQQKLVEIWSEVLEIGQDKIGIHSNFFELGGHSISLIRLNSAINAHFKGRISIADMFRLPTIRSLETFIINGEEGLGKTAENFDESAKEAEDNMALLQDL
jgi:acyl carrier protein